MITIIRAHNQTYGDRLLFGGAYITAGLANGFDGGTFFAGNSWWGAILLGLVIFFVVGFFISRYTTKLALTRLVAIAAVVGGIYGLGGYKIGGSERSIAFAYAG